MSNTNGNSAGRFRESNRKSIYPMGNNPHSMLVNALLIEDDPDDVLLMREMLTELKDASFNINMENVSRLQMALEQLTLKSFDIIFLDLHLPDSYGLNTLTKLLYHKNDIPVVVLTTIDDEQIGIRAIKEGAQDYLAKGRISSDILFRSMCYSIERHDILLILQQQMDVSKENESNLRIIIEQSVDGIIVLNRKGIICFANPAAKSMLQFSTNDIVGELFELPVSENMHTEIDITHKDGSSITAEIHITEITWKGELAYLATLRDISARARINKMKDDFISTVSHELRTPLTSIMNSLFIIDEISTEKLGIPEIDQMVKIALRNGGHLVRILNDILSIRKFEAGEMDFDIKPLELMPLVKEAIDSNIAYVKNLDVDLVLKKSIPNVKVNVDGNRLIQVLTNLISNAAKVSLPGDEVEISVSRYDTAIRVSITHGPGIPREFYGHIFQKFAQIGNVDTRAKSGTGLGLNIAKSIIERMGGKINFLTEVGKGTTFYFDLPEYRDV